MVSGESNGQVICSESSQLVGPKDSVVDVVAPPAGRSESDAAPNRCKRSWNCAKTGARLADVMKERGLSAMLGVGTAFDVVSVPLILVLLAEERSCECRAQYLANMELLAGSKRLGCQESEESTDEVHDNLGNARFAVDASRRCRSVFHPVITDCLPAFNTDAERSVPDSLYRCIDVVEVDLEILDDAHRLGAFRGCSTRVSKCVAIIHVTCELTVLVCAKLSELVQERASFFRQGGERLLNVDGWHRNLQDGPYPRIVHGLCPGR